MIMHFDEYPLSRDMVNIPEEQVEGHKFKNWQENANYTVQTTVIIQCDTTNVTAAEHNIAPEIYAISTNQSLINIYRVWHRNGVSFSEFQSYYTQRETALNSYVDGLVSRLNAARRAGGKYGDWYVNYSLNERHVAVYNPEGSSGEEE